MPSGRCVTLPAGGRVTPGERARPRPGPPFSLDRARLRYLRLTTPGPGPSPRSNSLAPPWQHPPWRNIKPGDTRTPASALLLNLTDRPFIMPAGRAARHATAGGAAFVVGRVNFAMDLRKWTFRTMPPRRRLPKVGRIRARHTFREERGGGPRETDDLGVRSHLPHPRREGGGRQACQVPALRDRRPRAGRRGAGAEGAEGGGTVRAKVKGLTYWTPRSPHANEHTAPSIHRSAWKANSPNFPFGGTPEGRIAPVLCGAIFLWQRTLRGATCRCVMRQTTPICG